MEFSLRVAYDLPVGRLLILVTNTGGAPLAGTTRVRIALMSEGSTTVLIGLKEKDESQYHALVPLQAGEDFAIAELPFADFGLADYSTDENGTFDIDQVTELSVNDISSVVGEPVGPNTLWIDDVLFVE